jgi:ABC-type dipeptide/oligopeptide/nickel transport system ATPase subunit
MTRIVDRIWSWAATELKYWEQAALLKIVEDVDLEEKDYRQLVGYFEHRAALVPPAALPKLLFPKPEVIEAKLAKCRLERIFNMENVNALPVGQEIHFGKELTLIYGDNGVGKTGYVRPLGSAGFARGRREVLPNAAREKASVLPQADIEVSYGEFKETIRWVAGDRPEELQRFYVFDAESVNPHLTESNSLSFSPAGLSILTRLAELTDQVRERIRERIAECEKPHNFSALFQGDSDVSSIVSNMDLHTDVDELEKLSRLSSEEAARLDELEKIIAELKLLNVVKQIEKRTNEINDIHDLLTSLAEAKENLGESAEEEAGHLISAVTAQREAVSKFGVDQFKCEPLTQTGTAAWLDFLHAAKSLADAERVGDKKYPEQGDPCLLCHQPLPSEAVRLIRTFWAFLLSDPQAKLEAAERACREKIRELEQVVLTFFGPSTGVRRIIEEDLPGIVPAIEAQIESLEVRRNEFIESLRCSERRNMAPLTIFETTDLEVLVKLLQHEIDELSASDVGMRLIVAEDSLRRLKHRQILHGQLPSMESYVDAAKWANGARQGLGTTRAITEKYNELFDELVTKRYKSLFEDTLRRFKPDMRVVIETRGVKGETVRQIALSPETNVRSYPIDRILSDGEKKAVAFADFLTEVSLDKLNSGIILDDPVTSLDDKWKSLLARCLTEQAKDRQVIIFTHDLAFLYQIKACSAEIGIDVVTHWIKEEDGHPGFVYLNNSPVCEQDFKSAQIARDRYAECEGLEPARQQKLLQQGFGALRTSYEALIIFEVFNGVVGRFEERISFDRLQDVCVDHDLIEQVIARMGQLSRHIDAHLHSDKFAPTKPTRAELLEEINAFEDIRRKQKELKKKRNIELGKSAGIVPSKPNLMQGN